MKKQVSMTRQRYNHAPHTNQCNHEKEAQNSKSLMALTGNKSKAISSLFPSEMIAKTESTPSTAQQNKNYTQDPDKTLGATTNNELSATESLP